MRIDAGALLAEASNSMPLAPGRWPGSGFTARRIRFPALGPIRSVFGNGEARRAATDRFRAAVRIRFNDRSSPVPVDGSCATIPSTALDKEPTCPSPTRTSSWPQ